jgi:glycosyltransferase involved in cell wall biosynthesis
VTLVLPASPSATAAEKLRVVACVRHYLPGYRSGGPVRTISNLVEHLGDEIDFRIVTSDRDALAVAPYPNVAIDAWQPVGKARVYYASPSSQTLRGMTAILNAIDYDVLYLNSFFDSRFTILPLLARRLGRLRDRPVVVAPRGEFSRGALGIRSWKKWPYIALAQALRLYAGVTWHSSSAFEKKDLARVLGDHAAQAAVIAVNLPHKQDAGGTDRWQPRQSGAPLRVVFLSRVSPMKNLDYGLRLLAAAKTPLMFDIYGVVDDPGYWAHCQQLITRLPAHVRVTYHGEIPHEFVAETLARYDVFFLPTQGENYGHAIAESLSQGTPVLISDHTPWRGLHALGVGWDLALEPSGHSFIDALHTLAGMAEHDYLHMRKKTALYASRQLDLGESLDATRRLFLDAANKSSEGPPCVARN